MYVAVKGGEQAIDNAHKWLAEARRGDPCRRRNRTCIRLASRLSLGC